MSMRKKNPGMQLQVKDAHLQRSSLCVCQPHGWVQHHTPQAQAVKVVAHQLALRRRALAGLVRSNTQALGERRGVENSQAIPAALHRRRQACCNAQARFRAADPGCVVLKQVAACIPSHPDIPKWCVCLPRCPRPSIDT